MDVVAPPSELSKFKTSSLPVLTLHLSQSSDVLKTYLSVDPVHSIHFLNALLAELKEYSVTLVVLPLHKLSYRLFSNSEAPFEIEIILVCSPATFSYELKAEFICTLLVLAIEVSTLCLALLAQA